MKKNALSRAVAAAAVAVLLLAVWEQRTAIVRLNEQNQALQEKLSRETAGKPATVQPVPTTAATPSPAASVPAIPPTAPVAKTPPSPAQPTLVETPTGEAPAPRESGLVLAGTHVAPIAGGLSANLHFNPTTTEPLGIVAMVVRLPKDGQSRILDVAPTGDMKYADVSKRVSEDGSFAIFQGTPQAVAALDFALSVSGPATADVRGTCGIGAFDLEISPTAATARNK